MIMGSVALAGRYPEIMEIFSRISKVAKFMSVSISNSIIVMELPAVVMETMVFSPSQEASAASTGRVIMVSTSSGDALG